MKQNISNPKSKGFTLIELMVTLTIFVFMTALVVSKYGTFNQSTLLTSLAYDVALTIRTAQTYGVSVKTANETTSNPCGTDPTAQFQCAYGVHFAAPTSGGANNIFTMYAYPITIGTDVSTYFYPPDGSHDINQYTIKRGGIIASISVAAIGSNSYTDLTSGQSLDFIFKRPDSSAHVCLNNSGTINCTYGSARILIKGTSSALTRGILVYKNGQVTIED